MHRIYELPRRDQLKVWETLRDYLGGDVGEETAVERAAKKRAAALKAVARVAEHLGLPEGTAPTVTQYRKVWKEVAPGRSATRVHDTWGRYEFAKRALRGEPVPESPAQRSLRRQGGGRARTNEDHLEGVRKWLAEKPVH